MESLSITHGFDDTDRLVVALLYWEAFERKLRPGFSDNRDGVGVLQAAVRSDRFLVARSISRIVGVCGFHSTGAGALDLSWSLLRSRLSTAAALRAWLLLSPLGRAEKAGTLTLDGICVDRTARGSGVGTALLDAAYDLAVTAGASAVRLSVVDTNPRARSLYERQGFVPRNSGNLGILAPIYGFDHYTTMERGVCS
ncbi:GNAT family N-acetyltransferase [Arthrobacter sp. Rue61a]|uniref:GNAT family N-acetyltransferase n=1 Tax=Arthrobacter sp. Rue61a TaxID=1118963 RepID=UPI0005BDEB18|nr:GNAT family N-acetyltransferase [Arthrobacter sp. Rue61a]